MKPWRKTSLKVVKQLIFVFSALLLVVSAAFGSDLSDFRDDVASAETKEELQSVLDSAPVSVRSDSRFDGYLNGTVDEIINRNEAANDWTDIQQWFATDFSNTVLSTDLTIEGEIADPKQAAADILANPIYVDPKQSEDRNWVGDAGSRWSESFFAWLEGLTSPSSGAGNSLALGGLAGVQYVMWGILILGIGIVLFFILRNFKGISRRKKVGGILEEDEPERTADQWLLQAEKLESEGKFREAVRCLYLACLVRFDDGGVARFRRHETNWEHLYRIEASPDLPAGIEFRETTQQFDKIWYGHMINGVSDVHYFKEVYLAICKALGIKKAA